MTALAAGAGAGPGRWAPLSIDPATAAGRARAALYVTLAGHVVLLVAFGVTMSRVGQEPRGRERLTVAWASDAWAADAVAPVAPAVPATPAAQATPPAATAAAPAARPVPSTPPRAAAPAASASVADTAPVVREELPTLPRAASPAARDAAAEGAAGVALLAPHRPADRRWSGPSTYAVATPRRVVAFPPTEVLSRLQPTTAVTQADPTTDSPSGGGEPFVEVVQVQSGPTATERPLDIGIPYPPSLRSAGHEADIRIRVTVDAAGKVVGVDYLRSSGHGAVDAEVEQRIREHLFAAEAESSTVDVVVRFRLERPF